LFRLPDALGVVLGSVEPGTAAEPYPADAFDVDDFLAE